MSGDTRGRRWQIANTLRRNPALYWVARRGYSFANGLLPPKVVEGVPGRVHRNDLMIDGSDWSKRTYVTAALEAVEHVRAALRSAGRSLDQSDVLDFGCGHGRVVRHFAKQARSVTACDLDPEAVRFCASEFGAVPLFGAPEVERIPFAQYDAIWLGSVITHHPPEACRALLTALAGHVRPGGVLVVTNQDRATLDHFLEQPDMGWLRPSQALLRADLTAHGAAYVDYPQNEPGTYGLGFQTAPWLDEVVGATGLELVAHAAAPWVHQRVHSWRRPVGA